jgi:TP901 family phage tail tape measure protein
VKAFAEFDAKMSQIQTLSHATAVEMDGLKKSALTMGQAIGFSAIQVADAEIELVKAGVSVKDIMGGALKGALELAAAGQIEVGKATEIATIALTQFNLVGKDVPHVADLLSAGADKALGGVAELGEALKSGGLVAAQFGVSLDETIGTLSAFANAGLLGETAGTDLRQMLLKLANPAKESADEMKKLGISIYGANGQFVGISTLAGQLKDKMKDLTPEARNSALAIIFGSRAIAGANVLYKEGAKGIQGWTDSVNDSGFAAKQAAGKLDNLKGDVSKLAAAFNTDLIQSGSAANVMLRELVQGVTGIIGAVGSLPAPVLGAGLALTGLVAVVGLTGGAALLVVPKIAAFKAALVALDVSGRSAGMAIGAIAGAATGALVVIGLFAAGISASQNRIADLKASLDAATGATTKYTREVIATQLQQSGAAESGKALGLSLSTLTDAALGNADAIKKVDQAYAKSEFASNTTVSLIDQIGTSFGRIGSTQLQENLAGMNRNLEQSGKDLREQATAAAKSGDSTETAGEAYKKAADTAATLESNLTKLIDTINKANGVGQDAVSANANYRKALADVAEAVKKAKGGIDESTVAGSANAQMLADLAQKGEDAATKQFALDGNTTNYTKSLIDNRQAIYDAAIQMGATADAANALADKVAAIPTEKEIKILADTTVANAQIDAFILGVNGKIAKVPVGTIIRPGQVGVNANGGMYDYKKFADGGMASGIYAGRPGGIHKFAEPETVWEAYISGKPGQNARNRSIWAEAGQRLGIGSSTSNTNHATTNITNVINQVTDPTGTALALSRRMKAVSV